LVSSVSVVVSARLPCPTTAPSPSPSRPPPSCSLPLSISHWPFRPHEAPNPLRHRLRRSSARVARPSRPRPLARSSIPPALQPIPPGARPITMNGAAAPERSPSPSPPPPAQAQAQAPPSPSPAQPLEWRFSQVFGERSAGEEVQEGTDRSLLLHVLRLCVTRCCFLLDLSASVLRSSVGG
jgi:hypothetical protein